MPPTSLSRMTPTTSVTSRPADLAQIVGERPRARRIVRGVEEHVGAAPARLARAGPASARRSDPARIAVPSRRHAAVRTSSVMRQNATAALSIWCRPRRRQRHVVEPVFASLERDRRLADRRLVRARPRDAHALGRADERRAALAARRLDHGTCAGGDRSDDDRYPRLDDAGLLASDRFQGLSQEILVIEVDRRDDGGHRSYDVGRVQPAAQPDFDHRQLDRGAAEQLEGDRRRALEEGRQRVERAVAQRAVRRSSGRSPPRPRGRVASTSRSPMTNRSSIRSRCGDVYRAERYPAAWSAAEVIAVTEPLPLVPATMIERKLSFGMAERGADRRHVLETELHPETFEREEELEWQQRSGLGSGLGGDGFAFVLGSVGSSTLALWRRRRWRAPPAWPARRSAGCG